MADFLADNNLCGQTILKIVSRGNGILAKLLRLKENIPLVFKFEGKGEFSKYGEIISDLTYFSNTEAFEMKIEKNQALQELDEELRKNYHELLTKFYLLFESIYKYISDLNKFLEDVQNGLYIQMSFENILYNGEGKQLMAESIYLYGVMLLMIDWNIDGSVRERMLTSFYRYTSIQSSGTSVDDVCKLLRSTGLTKTKRPLNYPIDYFRRVPINQSFIHLLIGRLRSDDVYNQLGSYPLPEHRSTALSQQASILTVILFFSNNVLQEESALMREITDKFFSDNWIIPIYLDIHMNLLEAWDHFRAAKQALSNTVEVHNVKYICSKMGPKIDILSMEAEEILKEGVIGEENILEKFSKIINLLRESNVVLRWAMLHNTPIANQETNKKCKQNRDLIQNEIKYKPVKLLNLLLQIAQLELKVKELFKKLLSEKREKWIEKRNEAMERVKELAEVFSGNKPLTRIEKNENLYKWLEIKASQINSLDFDQLLMSGRKIIELIRAFDEMLEFHGLESKVEVREWVSETVTCLHKMLKTGSLNEDVLVSLQIVSDLSYAWGSLIDNYTPQMQELIQKDPFSVSKLRAVFLKLSSAMDMPLMRLNQAKSSELVTVSSYYSTELVSYVQKVLQIIPESLFRLLHEIIDVQTTSMKEIPTRLDKSKIKDFAQLEDRQKVSRLTHDMSILTEGILKMQTTLVGIIRVDPKKLLENGIRKELVMQLGRCFNDTLNFSPKNAVKDNLKTRLTILANKMDGIRRSFEYIGDYVNSYGLKIFQEELSRVTNFTTEQESNVYSKSKVLHFESIYQSRDVPLVVYPPEDSSAVTYMGRLANELINLTNPRTTIFITSNSTWYDIKSHTSLVSPELFALMEKAVDIQGLIGLDKLFSFMMVENLKKLVKSYETEASEKMALNSLTMIKHDLKPVTKLINHPIKTYQLWINKVAKNQQTLLYLKIGQLQLFRLQIQYQLRVSANCQAKQLYNAIAQMNELSADDLRENKTLHGNPTATFEIMNHSEPLGLYEPLSKVYIPQKQLNFLGLQLAFSTIYHLQKLTYSKGSLICRKASDAFDGYPFLIGVSTLLVQFNEQHTFNYISYLCQYLNSILSHMGNSSSPQKDDLLEAAVTYYFLKIFSQVSPIGESEVMKLVSLLVPPLNLIPNIVQSVINS